MKQEKEKLYSEVNKIAATLTGKLQSFPDKIFPCPPASPSTADDETDAAIAVHIFMLGY